MKKYLNIYNISRIGILGALGAILMIIDMPIFVAPSFYKLDISDLPCIIGAFAMGPIPSIFIVVVKIVIKMLIKPTSTAYVGELAAFIFSTTYCLIAGFIYQKNKTKTNAYKSIIISSIVFVLVSCVANYLFIIPAYVSLYHIPLESIIAAGTQIFSLVHDKFSFVLCCVLPFNLIKIIIVDILTLAMYKKVSPLLNKYNK